MSGSGPGSASAPPPPPPPPPPLAPPSPSKVAAKSREESSSSDAPRDHASALAQASPRDGSAPPPPPPPPAPLPPPPPARLTSESREDDWSSDSPRDHASALAQAFPGAGSAPPPPPTSPAPLPRLTPASLTSESREDDSSSDSPRDHASALAQAFPRAGSAPPSPPPPLLRSPSAARVASELREDESSSDPRRDQASSLAQAFPRTGSAPPPPPPPPVGPSNSRSDYRGWAVVHAFPSAIADESVRRGIDFTLNTMSPPGVTTLSIRRGSIFSDSEVPRSHGACPPRPLLRLHCIDFTGNLFLVSCTVTLGSEASRTELPVCHKERGRVITITTLPADLSRQFSTGNAAVGIVAIPGGQSDGDMDFIVSHLFPSCVAPVDSANAPRRFAISTSLDSEDMATFCYYQSNTATWRTRQAAITCCREFSGFRQVHSVLCVDKKLLGFVDLSSGLVVSTPLGEHASFLKFPEPDASTDCAIGARRCFGRSDELLVFVAMHNSPPSISTWTSAMENEGDAGWTPQHHRVPLLDIKAEISAGLFPWGEMAPSVIFVHPLDTNLVFLSRGGLIYCVDLEKKNMIGLPQIMPSSSLSSMDFCVWLMPEVTDEVCWEMVQSDEIVDCNTDSKDRCAFIHKVKVRDSPWRTRLLYNKYTDYGINLLENNRSRVESLQKGAEWVGEMAPLADKLLPLPVCSFAVQAASHLSRATKVGGHAMQYLRSVIPPPEDFVVYGVANEAQAKYAVNRWNDSSRSELHIIQIVDRDQSLTVKRVLKELDALRLLWFYHPELCEKSEKK